MVLFLLRLSDRSLDLSSLQERKVIMGIRRMNSQEISMAGLYLMTWAILNLDPDDPVQEAVRTVSDKMVEDALDAEVSRLFGGL